MATELSVQGPGLAPWLASLVPQLMDFGLPSASPAVAQLVLGLLAAGALAFALAKRAVVQLPALRLAAPIAGFFAVLGLSIVLSSFKMVTLSALAEWLSYGVAFFAVVASAGRVEGPRLILWSLFLGCVVVAAFGLLEYGHSPPGWRIFGGWQNPNALAGMLVIGLFCGCGLAAASERVARLAATFGAGVIGLALALTQSKAGLGAAIAGAVAFLLALALFRSGRATVLSALAPLILVGLLVGALSLRNSSSPAAAAPLGRIASASQTQSQSLGFRINVWKSSLDLIKANPLGYGLGTFQFHSAKPGRVMYVVRAHQSFLELAVDAGPLALILLLVFLGVLAWEILRSRILPSEQNALRAAVFGALVAAAAHSLFDSDLYLMGTGLAFFLLCGIGLQLSGDGGSPELLPKQSRVWAIACASTLALLVAYSSLIGIVKARVYYDLAEGNASAREGVALLRSFAPADGEAAYLGYLTAQSALEAASSLRDAIRLRPTPKYFRALAQLQMRSGKPAAAVATLQELSSWDPNNLAGLALRMEALQAAGDRTGAVETARRLASLTETTAFKTRALPEQVPLEPYNAALFLADSATSTKIEYQHLAKALSGYVEYAKYVPGNIASGLVKPEEARRVIDKGLEIAGRVRRAYGLLSTGPPRLADDAEATFNSALAALDR